MKSTALVPYGQSRPFSIASLLPQPPWLGPPLPQFLGIVWPWLQSRGSFLASLPHPFVSNVDAGVEHSTALTTSDNLEEIDFPEGFDPDTFMPKKIRIKRHKEIK